MADAAPFAPATQTLPKPRKTAPQVSSTRKAGIRTPTYPVTYPAPAKPTPTMIEGDEGETTPLSGARFVKSRAKGLPTPRPPARKRAKPAAQLSDAKGQALRLARYQELLAGMAGAFGLYLHGAATLPNPTMDDLTNIEEFTFMIRGVGLPSVGFE